MSKKPSVKEEKGVYILELDASGDMSQTFHTLEVKRPIVVLQESFETLMSPEFYKNQPCQKAWFAFDIQLSSRKELEGINVRARLEEIYGTDIVEITFSRLGDVREENVTVDQHLKDLEMQSPQEIVSDFYQTVTGAMSCLRDKQPLWKVFLRRLEGADNETSPVRIDQFWTLS